jgi:hypothetical protein
VFEAIAVAQLLWAALYPVPAVHRAAAAILSFATIATALRPPAQRGPVVALLSVLSAANLLVFVLVAAPPFPGRVYLLALLTAFVAVGVAASVATEKVPMPMVFIVIMVGAAPFLGIEQFLTRYLPPVLSNGQPAAEPIAAPRPQEDGSYERGSVVRVAYPEDPRDYFGSPDDAQRGWHLTVADTGSEATLEFPDEQPGVMRVRATRVRGRALWHIRLAQTPLPIQAGEQYRLSFRAQADQPRTMAFAISQGRPPWTDLGLYQEARIDSVPRQFDERFRSPESDRAALLRFDLGGSVGTAEISNVVITRLSSGGRIRTTAQREFYVEYRFNESGCRGPATDTAAGPAVVRILSLGDSYTLGAGVHERDTYTARLERMLNERKSRAAAGSVPPAARRYEVMNCGVTGYGTAEARALYERVASRYAPQLVLLSVAAGDDIGRDDDVALGGLRPSTRMQHLFLTATYLKARRTARDDEGDPSRTVAELRQLRERTEADGRRLAVLLFAMRRDEGEQRWVDAVTRELRGSGVPMLNIGPRLRAYREDELFVHPVLDRHPNDVAHRVVAEALLRLIDQQRLLPSMPVPSVQPRRVPTARRPR